MLAAVLAVGSAYAAWQFHSVGRSDVPLTDGRDDILENYNIKKAGEDEKNTINTYEMYLYPSTLYLNDYIECFDKDGKLKADAVFPEEKYGYIEPVIDGNSGEVTYAVHNADGAEGDSSYLRDVSLNTSHTMADDNYIKGMYYNVYQKVSEWQGNVTDGKLTGTVDVGGQTVKANSKYLYGDPVLDDEAEVVYDDNTTGTSLSNTDGERHNWRNLHYYDRFGYWAYLAKGEGRYLPVKITVDENFNNTYFNKATMTPLADMGDPHDWFVYSFTCWSYVAYDESAKTYTLPYYATEEFAKANASTLYVDRTTKALNPSLSSFCPTMVSQYFDIIESFDKYADENGVIRLFPKFSNGKGYQASAGLGEAKDGAGDAVKVVPQLKGKDKDGNDIAVGMSANDQHELFMFFSTEEGTVSGRAVNVAVLPNIDIDKYYSLNFRCSIVSVMANWSTWSDVYMFDRTAKKEGATDKNILDTLNSYGYGLYNLYLFITDLGSTPAYTDLTDGLETMRQNLVNKSDKSNFPSLYGKNLLPVATAYVGGKSFMLVGEKVREAKFIGDVNFGAEAPSAGADGEFFKTYTSEEKLYDGYLKTDKSFRLINKDLLGCEKNSDTLGANPINEHFPYCYILQNVDFTEATTQYCQIRFQRNYRADLHFAETGEYAYKYVQFDGTNYEQAFSHYFTLENVKVYSQEDNSATEQQVIRLKDEEMRGVYDIIMVFRSAREGDSPSAKYAYNIGLFAYRHTNIFLKVYGEDPAGKAYYTDGDNGVVKTDTDKTYEFIDHSAPALFEKSYPIGVSVKCDDANEQGTNAYGAALDACVNAEVLKKGYDPEKVRLYDHVTGAEVARYIKAEAGENESGVSYLSHNGDKYKLVIHAFKIRKNYIFYIKEI